MPSSNPQRSFLTRAKPVGGRSSRRRGRPRESGRAGVTVAKLAARCRRKFLRYYPGGFRDDDYRNLERNYKWHAHERWTAALDKRGFQSLLRSGDYAEIAARAVTIEARTNLLFSFEKMALRDAVKSKAGSRAFAEGLFAFLHGQGPMSERFDAWCGVISALPRRQTRVLTWPVITVFGFIAQPKTHFFLKPMVTRTAAARYGYLLAYRPRPQWDVYAEVLKFASVVRNDLRDLQPCDMIDLQSFLWVQGSDEYPE